MEYEKIIHEYIDGTLEQERELELFSVLTQNEELRQDFRSQIAIKNAIRSDVKAFTPKAESTMKIFSTLGFESPVPAVTPTPITVAPSAVSTGFFAGSGKIIQMIAGSVITAGLTAAILLFFLKPDLFSWFYSENSNSYSKNESSYPIIENYSDIPENNFLKYFIDDANDKKNTNIAPKIIYKYILVEKKDSDLAVNNKNDDSGMMKNSTSNLVLQKSEIMPVEKFQNDLKKYALNNSNISSPFDLNFSNNFSPKEAVGLKLEMRGNEVFYSEIERVNPASNQIFNNSAIAIFYSASDELDLGFEYRRENFYQKFSGWENSKFYVYEQQPNFETYNLALRYMPSIFKNDYLQPFAQGAFGLTNNSGQIGRIMIGAELLPESQWSMIAGAEYSFMGYNYQNKNFYTDKFGLNFGISYKF